jgi:ABC-2 type transport system permease protein
MLNIVSALLYLRITTFKNIVVSRLKRLKQPKYMLGGIAGAAYVYAMFFRRPRFNPTDIAIPGEVVTATLSMAAMALLGTALICWLWPRERSALKFSEAEIAFLFPAPLSRRTIINYQLISAQAGILLTALIVSFFSRRWSAMQGDAGIRLLGWWIIVATFSLHLMGSSFVLTRLLDRGYTSLRRFFVIAGVVLAIVLGIGAWIWNDVYAPNRNDFESFAAFSNYLVAMLNAGPLPWLLAPFKAVVKPLFAPDWMSFSRALFPALLIYALHYVWVVRSEVSFEEASIAKAEKKAAKVAAFKQGRYGLTEKKAKARVAAFDVSSAKRVEFAFMWKNLLASASYLRVRTFVIAAAILVVSNALLSANMIYLAIRPAIGIAMLVFGGYVLAFGPFVARQDLRNDLPNTDILKTYPLHGWQIILGEILAPVVVLTAMMWIVLLGVGLTAQSPRLPWLTPELRIFGVLGIGLIVPFLSAVQILTLNAAAVIFPAWIQNNQGPSGGIDVMGQRLLFMAGNVLIVGAALVPASAAGAFVFFISRWVSGDVIAIIFGTTAVAATLGAEIWIGIRLLGMQFEKFDLSAELRP